MHKQPALTFDASSAELASQTMSNEVITFESRNTNVSQVKNNTFEYGN